MARKRRNGLYKLMLWLSGGLGNGKGYGDTRLRNSAGTDSDTKQPDYVGLWWLMVTQTNNRTVSIGSGILPIGTREL